MNILLEEKERLGLIPEELLLQIRSDAEKHGIVRYRVSDILKEIGENVKEENFENIYWNLKITFYDKGIILRSGLTKNFEKIFVMRQKRMDDEYPKIRRNIWKCPGRIILSNDIIKCMENLKSKTSKDHLEYGFYLYYKEDLKLFPGKLQKGTEYYVLLGSEPDSEGAIIFGWFHTHPDINFGLESNLEKELARLPSSDDIIYLINDYLYERKYNHSTMVVLSELDDYASIYIPRENVSDDIYKKFMDDIIESQKTDISELDKLKIELDALVNLFHIFTFKTSYEKDIIIEYDPITGKYNPIK